MKLTHFCILFVAIMVIIVVQTDIRSDNLITFTDSKENMDFYMDRAMESAVETLLQVDTAGKLLMDKDKAVDKFFASMYASLGILSDKPAQERFKAYVPVIVVTDEDGYYLMYNDNYTGADGYTYITRRWTEKNPYSHEDNHFIYRFTLGDTFYLYDKNKIIDSSGTSKLYESRVEVIKNKTEYAGLRNILGSNSFLLNTEDFKIVRQTAIISLIEKDLSWYVSRHNDIAERLGITYRFSMPVTNTSDWAKTIEGPGLIIIFQGMPLMEGYSKVYNRMGFSGAGVRKGQVFYIEQRGWYYVYHREGCSLLEGNLNVSDEHVYSIKEASLLGAFACESCDPVGVHAPEYRP